MSARQPNLFEFDQNIHETSSTDAYKNNEVIQDEQQKDKEITTFTKCLLTLKAEVDFDENLLLIREKFNINKNIALLSKTLCKLGIE